MPEGKSLIEINGRVYDATTGELVQMRQSKSTVVKRRAIDGFMRQPSSENALQPHPEAVAAQKAHQKAQKTTRLHPSVHARTPQPVSGITRIKRTAEEIQELRARASASPKSTEIARHQSDSATSETPPTMVADEKIARPVPFLPKMTLENSQTAQRVQSTDTAEVPIKTSWLKHHLVPAMASFSALVMLGGYLIYNSLPNLTMRVAASRAGFNATVPNYQPSGFSFGGPISYGPGRVVIQFDSTTDEREYTITESRSAWDSQSLLANFVEDKGENYLTIQEHGLTLYLFDKAKATWVNEGVWYLIEGSANLNSEQLLKIAASL